MTARGSTPSADAAPVFVVGPSRSGTALTRAILNRHPDVALAGETHYFDDLRPRLRGKERTVLTEEDRRRCEDYFLALSHRPYGHGGRASESRLPREELRATADALGAGADAYFEAFCRLHARREGAAVWGEKTPRHVFRIDDILERYPDARIVGMIRDPRAIVASYRDWRIGYGAFDLDADAEHREAVEHDTARARSSFHVVLLALLWRSQAGALRAAAQRWPGSVRTVRYEDLATDPEPVVRELVAWLGLEFDRSMLDVPVLNSSFTPFTPGAGISTAAIERWVDVLGTDEIGAVQSACGPTMDALGYERSDAPMTWGVVREWLELPLAGARSLVANRERIASIAPYVYRRARHLTRPSGRGA